METLFTPEKIQNTINMITGGTNQQLENANDEVSSTQRVRGTNQQLENANNNIYNTNAFKIFKIIYGIKKIEDREHEKISIPDDSKTN
jgi:hypothetical protein